MGTEFTNVTEEIFRIVGTKENILSVGKCMTRLRLKLKDKKKVDIGIIKGVEGILGVVETQEQLQLIIEPQKARGLINEFIQVYKIKG